jgi:hypothetical protein
MYRTRRRRACERIVEIPDERLAEFYCAHHRMHEPLIALGLPTTALSTPDPHPWDAGLGRLNPCPSLRVPS